eukprot:Gregarina_sp_Poly_1__9543@NODE_600_length_7248_cov_149_324885_g463_i0_p9_GENE_NODE_600_length_7248_cov_149_324885_g463_i0NODE_600_length_7248_cov_149_324885_g463_i0_p9_ORF_typecomplete_len167_score13_28_NODE_600_length_7248_cov_149_324885_g463_i041794679
MILQITHNTNMATGLVLDGGCWDALLMEQSTARFTWIPVLTNQDLTLVSPKILESHHDILILIGLYTLPLISLDAVTHDLRFAFDFETRRSLLEAILSKDSLTPILNSRLDCKTGQKTTTIIIDSKECESEILYDAIIDIDSQEVIVDRVQTVRKTMRNLLASIFH